MSLFLPSSTEHEDNGHSLTEYGKDSEQSLGEDEDNQHSPREDEEENNEQGEDEGEDNEHSPREDEDEGNEHSSGEDEDEDNEHPGEDENNEYSPGEDEDEDNEHSPGEDENTQHSPGDEEDNEHSLREDEDNQHSRGENNGYSFVPASSFVDTLHSRISFASNLSQGGTDLVKILIAVVALAIGFAMYALNKQRKAKEQSRIDREARIAAEQRAKALEEQSRAKEQKSKMDKAAAARRYSYYHPPISPIYYRGTAPTGDLEKDVKNVLDKVDSFANIYY